MTPDRVVESIDIAGNGLLGLVTGVEDRPPDEFGFDRLEERIDHRVIVAIPLAGHGDADAVATQLGLVLHGTILAAAVRMMNEPLGRTPQDEGLAQRRQREIAVQPVADNLRLSFSLDGNTIGRCPADQSTGRDQLISVSMKKTSRGVMPM